jgi:hypothetical protein
MREMSEDKNTNTEKTTIDVTELEKELKIKEAMKERVEVAYNQMLGQIACLKELINKAKGIKTPGKEDKQGKNKEGTEK